MSKLHEAVNKAHTSLMIQELANKELNIDFQDSTGLTALHYAAKNGHRYALRLLMEKGANLEALDFAGNTPLLSALSSHTAYAGVADFLELAMCYGANTKASNTKKHGINELASVDLLLFVDEIQSRFKRLQQAVISGKIDFVAALLKKPVNINFADAKNSTLLHLAVTSGNKEVVSLLLMEGANSTLKNSDGLTAAELATKLGKNDLFLEIKNYNSYRETVFDLVKNDNVSGLKELIRKGVPLGIKDAQRNTLAELAIRYDSKEVFKLLLSQPGFKLKTNSFWGDTLLHTAAMYGRDEILKYILTSNDAFCAQISAQDRYGLTALHRAAQFSKPEIIDTLVRAGADLEMRDQWNCTALHWACHCGYGFAVAALLKHNSQAAVLNQWSKTPWQLVVENGHEKQIKFESLKTAEERIANKGEGVNKEINTMRAELNHLARKVDQLGTSKVLQEEPQPDLKKTPAFF